MQPQGLLKKKLLGWFVLVVIFFMIFSVVFSRYMARVQMGEVIYFVSFYEKEVKSYYEKYQHCPKDNDIPNLKETYGKFLESLSLVFSEAVDRCYIRATVRNYDAIDPSIRGKSLLLVIEPASLWQSKVICNTNLKTNLAGCQ